MPYSFLPCASVTEWTERAARFIRQKIAEAQQKDGMCVVGLSGGKTPRAVFCAPHPDPLPPFGLELMAERRGEGALHFFLVDERYVPPDHPESNQRMVRETLEDHIVFPDTTLPIDECVEDYARRLKALWKERLPHLIILGMGTDGHIASLFPPLSDLALGDEALILHTLAPEGIGPPDARDRITLSLNAICAADEQVLLLQGEKKKRVWEEMMASPEDERRWPLKRVIATGNLTVIGPATATA